jgi:hypothetical protein
MQPKCNHRDASAPRLDMKALKFTFVRRATLSDLRWQFAALVSYIRRLFTRGQRHGPGGQAPGSSYVSVPVPVGPKPPHHLQAAKEIPPSDKTRSFPKD